MFHRRPDRRAIGGLPQLRGPIRAPGQNPLPVLTPDRPLDSPVVPMMMYRPNALFTDGEEHRRLRGAITDSLARVEDDGPRVRIGFDRAPAREVDLVIGADGLHSRVRRLVFGPNDSFQRSMGCHVATFELAGYRPRDERIYVAHTAPGRYIARFPVRDDRTLFFVLMRDEYLAGATPRDDAGRKTALQAALSGIYSAALYRYAVGAGDSEGFDAKLLGQAFRTK